MTEEQSAIQPKEAKVDNKPSLETGNGCFELHYDFSNAKHFSMPRMVKSYFHAFAKPQPEKIYLISSVKHLSPEVVEVRRKILYKNFYNPAETMPEEVFTINRKALGKKGKVVMQMLSSYPGFKQEAIRVFSIGYMIRRCLLERDKCTAFQDPARLKMLSDVYMFKQLQIDKHIQQEIEEVSENEKLSKENLNSLRMSDLFDLI